MSNNKQQTAVEWLEETMLKPLIQWPDDIWEQAKEKHKEEIINAVDGFPLENRNLNGIEYYEQTYGGDK
jgi:predicted flavoprotein YhiN